MTTSGASDPVPESLLALSSSQARALAQEHGLSQVGVRPGIWAYTRQIWRRRSFLLSLSQGSFIARHQNNVLGLAWSLLNPLLLGAAYLVVFGLLLNTRGNVENFVGFLISGLLVFIFISAAMGYAGKSLIDGVSMMRALRFPRAILPISATTAELLAALPAFLVIAVVVWLTEPAGPTWTWLLYPVALGIIAVMTVGIGLVLARLVHEFRDLANLIPLMVRLLRYVSGVFFPIAHYVDQAVSERGFPLWLGSAMEFQPIAVSLTMVREALLAEATPQATTWIAGVSWAVGFVVVGYVAFWRAEARYGRG